MSPKIRAPGSSIQGPTRRKRRRASVFVNRTALKQWLAAPTPSTRNSGEVPVVQLEAGEEDEEPKAAA